MSSPDRGSWKELSEGESSWKELRVKIRHEAGWRMRRGEAIAGEATKEGESGAARGSCTLQL